MAIQTSSAGLVMTDKKLLELAAKAAGIELLYWSEISEGFKLKDVLVYWNPLTDDGDALRLAVKLRMQPFIGLHTTCIVQTGDFIFTEVHNDDPCAATRRAIVRAAAEIGKTL